VSKRNFLPPWYDAATGENYGPTPETFVRRIARHKDWAYRTPFGAAAHERPDAKGVHRYVAEHHADVPASELEAYRMIYVQRMSLSEAAEDSGWSRSTVRSYIARLRSRVEEAQEPGDPG
jgi:DNA-directed RNA polymerase specialized sigma24 family protein